MPGFLYYLPGQTSIDDAKIAELGLAYAFAGSGLNWVSLTAGIGPDGASGGVIFSPSATVPPGRNGYHRELQTWRQIPGGSRVWVGYYTAERPAPEHLARADLVTGYLLELADGRSWLCPTARGLRITGEEDPQSQLGITWHRRLPERLDLAADGRWITSGVLVKFAALWELAEQWASVCWGDADETARTRFDGQGAVDAAIVCLQTNYRLGRVEAAMLGLVTDELVNEILDRLIDRPVLVEYMKKKAMRAQSSQQAGPSSSGSASSAGPAAGIPATPPPSPTAGPSPTDSPTPNQSTSTSSS